MNNEKRARIEIEGGGKKKWKEGYQCMNSQESMEEDRENENVKHCLFGKTGRATNGTGGSAWGCGWERGRNKRKWREERSVRQEEFQEYKAGHVVPWGSVHQPLPRDTFHQPLPRGTFNQPLPRGTHQPPLPRGHTYIRVITGYSKRWRM